MDKKKELVILRYQDEIYKLHLERKSIREIEKIIRLKSSHCPLKETIGKSTIAKVINKLKKIRGENGETGNI